MIEAGDKFKVIESFYTRGVIKHFALSKFYEKGMIIEVIEPTSKDPWDYKDPGGNWLVKCPFFHPPQPESVWAATYGLDMLIHKKWLEKINE